MGQAGKNFRFLPEGLKLGDVTGRSMRACVTARPLLSLVFLVDNATKTGALAHRTQTGRERQLRRRIQSGRLTLSSERQYSFVGYRPAWEISDVTKKEIVKTISDKHQLTQLKTKEIVQSTFEAIIETLVEEHRIELRNFGVFEVKKRAARKARNPRTGERVDVAEKYVVTFKPGKEMEERVLRLEQEEAARAAQSLPVAPNPPIATNGDVASGDSSPGADL